MKPIVVIGSGLAGYTLARELRKLDQSAPLLIITADHGGFYSKPMLSNAFAQRKQAHQLITQSATRMAEQLNANIMTGVRVERIDGAAHRVETNAGSFDYRALVIAAGAQSIRLGLDGDAADAVMSVNHIDDYVLLRERIAARVDGLPARIAILGAGLIGCEFADDLAGSGHAITVVDPNRLPLSALAAPALSQGLRQALQARGVEWRLGTTAARIDRGRTGLRLTLADGNAFEADAVLSAVGLRADLRLARASQLATARGILVDTYGRSSAPDIYALGDCAEYLDAGGNSTTLPYIAPQMAAARAIARTLAGQPTPIVLDAAPVIVKTPSYPMALVPPPRHTVGRGNWQVQVQDGRTICRFVDVDGMVRGFGVAPQDAAMRQVLLAELGTSLAATPA